MRFTTTFAGRRILRAYWFDQKPFTLDMLIQKGVLSSRFLGRILLWDMKRKSQIIARDSDGKCYVATTESREEWENLKFIEALSRFSCDALPLNRYEIKKRAQEMENLLNVL